MSSSQEMQNMVVHQTIHENVAVESNYGNMMFFLYKLTKICTKRVFCY